MRTFKVLVVNAGNFYVYSVTHIKDWKTFKIEKLTFKRTKFVFYVSVLTLILVVLFNFHK